jgi:hypothetical protein
MVGTVDWVSGRVRAPACIRVRWERGADMSNGMPGRDAMHLLRSVVDGAQDRGLPIVALDAQWALIRACCLHTATR